MGVFEVSTFYDLMKKEINEVRQNDRILSHSDAFTHIHFAIESLSDIVRQLLACQTTETEANPQILQALVCIGTLAQHSAESLNLCNAEELEQIVSHDKLEDLTYAFDWIITYIVQNQKSIPPIQIGGDDRFSVEFDWQDIQTLIDVNSRS